MERQVVEPGPVHSHPEDVGHRVRVGQRLEGGLVSPLERREHLLPGPRSRAQVDVGVAEQPLERHHLCPGRPGNHQPPVFGAEHHVDRTQGTAHPAVGVEPALDGGLLDDPGTPEDTAPCVRRQDRQQDQERAADRRGPPRLLPGGRRPDRNQESCPLDPLLGPRPESADAIPDQQRLRDPQVEHQVVSRHHRRPSPGRGRERVAEQGQGASDPLADHPRFHASTLPRFHASTLPRAARRPRAGRAPRRLTTCNDRSAAGAPANSPTTTPRASAPGSGSPGGSARRWKRAAASRPARPLRREARTVRVPPVGLVWRDERTRP